MHKKPSTNALEWLQDWYTTQCNGEWEHSKGVSIDTIDNPGWTIKIDLAGTDLEDIPFLKKESNYDSENDWYVVKVENNVFSAQGAPSKLLSMILEFVAFANQLNRVPRTPKS